MWLFEDNHLLTLNKPPGLLSQADSSGSPDVVTLAKKYIKEKYRKPGNVYIGLVHRLDRPTSGAMVLARTSKAARRLSQTFRERNVNKTYNALVEGVLTGSGVMEDYLHKEADRAYVVPASEQGKYASLRWHAVESNGTHTRVSIELITGRAHQIRCQFSERGFPILGDIRYGACQNFAKSGQIALHCQNLHFLHPVRKTPMEVKAAFPGFWGKFVNNSKIH